MRNYNIEHIGSELRHLSRIITGIVIVTIILGFSIHDVYATTSGSTSKPVDVIWFGYSNQTGLGSPNAILHLQSQGLTVEHRSRPIQNLTDAKVVVVAPTGIFNTFSNSEISNLKSFVNGGGGLVFTADTDYFYCHPVSQCSIEVSSNFGFEYRGDLQYGSLVPARGQSGHPIWNTPNKISSFTDWCCDGYVPVILDPTNVKIVGVTSSFDAANGKYVTNGSAIVLNENPSFHGGKVLATGYNMLVGLSGDFSMLDNVISFMLDPPADPPPRHSDSTPGVYNPPSIGNDYYNQYGSGISINGKSFDIKNYHSVIPQQVLTIGTPATFDFKIYDERGASTISHVGMYLHFKGDVMAPDADTWISWDKKDGIQVHDPNGIFANAKVTTKTDDHYLYATFTVTPQKTMDDSSLIMRMWDDKLASGDVPIWGAIIIVDPNAPVPVQKIPDNQYGDYITLQKILDKEGYQIPSVLRHERDMQQSYSSVDINWVYDKPNEKLTMIESDKSGNVIGDVVYSLFKKSAEPTVTDHDYVYIPAQLNRQDVNAEQAAMQQEAQKAQKYLVQTEYIGSTPSFVPSSHAMPILGQYTYFKAQQLYYTNHAAENAAMKSEAQKAEQLAESLGILQHSNFDNLSN